jgi:hypothetical protein
MPILEDLKEYAERATGLRRPRKRGAPELVRVRKPRTVRFEHDGLVQTIRGGSQSSIAVRSISTSSTTRRHLRLRALSLKDP